MGYYIVLGAACFNVLLSITGERRSVTRVHIITIRIPKAAAWLDNPASDSALNRLSLSIALWPRRIIRKYRIDSSLSCVYINGCT